jgi:ABC-type transport system involved in cytochrome c biogenesis permease subunit
MQQRNPVTVFFLSLITFGIYSLVWEVKTKNELKSQGADIPTAWLIIVPIANLYWIWKYSLGVEQVSKGKVSAVLTLILLLLLSIVGQPILQSEFNKLGTAPAGDGPAPIPPTAPEPPAGPTVTPPTI